MGLLVAAEAAARPGVVLVPLPVVVLIGIVARDRTRRIDAALERPVARGRERERLQGAVRRLGEAFAPGPTSSRCSTSSRCPPPEVLSAVHGEARVLGAPPEVRRVALPGSPEAAALTDAVVAVAVRARAGSALAERDGCTRSPCRYAARPASASASSRCAVRARSPRPSARCSTSSATARRSPPPTRCAMSGCTSKR